MTVSVNVDDWNAKCLKFNWIFQSAPKSNKLSVRSSRKSLLDFLRQGRGGPVEIHKLFNLNVKRVFNWLLVEGVRDVLINLSI